MSAAEIPADGEVASPTRAKRASATAYISWTALALMTTSSVASLRAAPTMAVYGLACVFLYLLPAVVFLGMWFFVQFLNGINQLPIFERDAISGGVAFWAHVMGFITGVALVFVMRRPERTRVEWWDTLES